MALFSARYCEVMFFHVSPKILLDSYGMLFYLVSQLRNKALKRHNMGNMLKVVKGLQRGSFKGNFFRVIFKLSLPDSAALCKQPT